MQRGLRVSLGPFLRDAWQLATPYFRSEERWFARGMFAVIITMNLFMVLLDVVLNFWNGAMYDSLQGKNAAVFTRLLFTGEFTSKGVFGFMPGFCMIAVVYITVAVYARYLNQWLQIRWRRWMTHRLLDDWLADGAYYRISLTAGTGALATDNPDQRIADDVNDYVTNALALSLDLLSNIVTLFSFLDILWNLSGPLALFGLRIPGYMVWAALLYAIVGSWLTQLVGRPLAALNFGQQRFEANFRFALVRLRENMEGIALHGGEADERATLSGQFANLVGNWYAIMRRTKFLNSLTVGYAQVANIFPVVVAAPRYFAGRIELGGLMRITNAFGQVQGAMSWFIDSYATLASWNAQVERLATFQRAILAARAAAAEAAVVRTSPTGDLVLRDLTLSLPGGERLLGNANATLRRGEAVLISGRSGSGKSTLFRALAGIWPFSSGAVERPAGSSLFLPQRPYIPLGTLRHAVTYPAAEPLPDAAIRAALADAGLGYLVPELDCDMQWAQRLSGGEQQRLAIARALLLRPDWLFLDEATASLDEEAQAALHARLREQLPATTIVSIAHREALAAFHERRIAFRESPGAPGRGGQLIENSSVPASVPNSTPA